MAAKRRVQTVSTTSSGRFVRWTAPVFASPVPLSGLNAKFRLQEACTRSRGLFPSEPGAKVQTLPCVTVPLSLRRVCWSRFGLLRPPLPPLPLLWNAVPTSVPQPLCSLPNTNGWGTGGDHTLSSFPNSQARDQKWKCKDKVFQVLPLPGQTRSVLGALREVMGEVEQKKKASVGRGFPVAPSRDPVWRPGANPETRCSSALPHPLLDRASASRGSYLRWLVNYVLPAIPLCASAGSGAGPSLLLKGPRTRESPLPFANFLQRLTNFFLSPAPDSFLHIDNRPSVSV